MSSNVSYALDRAINAATNLWHEQSAAVHLSGDSYWSDGAKEIRRAVKRNKADDIKMVRTAIVSFVSSTIGAQMRDMTADESFTVLRSALFLETQQLQRRASKAICKLADEVCEHGSGRATYVKEYRDVIAAYNGFVNAWDSLHCRTRWRNSDDVGELDTMLAQFKKKAEEIMAHIDKMVEDGRNIKKTARVKNKE